MAIEIYPSSEPLDLVASGAQHGPLEVLIRYARSQPRSIEQFRSRVLSLCTLNESVAQQMLYALPRRGKDNQPISIEGPSVRMAEIVIKSWQHTSVDAFVVDRTPEFVTAKARVVDFEDLTMFSTDATRRVLGRHSDARTLAEQAAIAVARRNAILGAIPRALWWEAYERAKEVAAGTFETLEKRRTEAIEWVTAKGVSEERIFSALDVAGMSDIGLEQLGLLKTLVLQVRSGEMTAADAFPDPKAEKDEKGKGVAGLKEKLGVTKTEGKDADQSKSPA